MGDGVKTSSVIEEKALVAAKLMFEKGIDVQVIKGTCLYVNRSKAMKGSEVDGQKFYFCWPD